MPRGRRGRPRLEGSLQAVRSARKAAAHALAALRAEIASLRSRLDELVAEQKSFVSNLFPSAGTAHRRGRQGRRLGRVERGPVRRRGPAKADTFFAKLPPRFTLDAVRKVAGRLAGVSLAQWARAKKITKTASGYVKSAVKPVTKKAVRPRMKRRRRIARKPPQKRTEPTAAAGKP
jgi:hypothetical protein